MMMESYAEGLRREILIALLGHPDTRVVVDASGNLRVVFSPRRAPRR